MTKYAGELLQVACRGSDFRDNPVTDDDVSAVRVQVFDAQYNLIVDEEMTYSSVAKLSAADTEEGAWVYLWETTDGSEALDAGTYRIRVEMEDVDGHKSIEWLKRERIAREPNA